MSQIQLSSPPYGAPSCWGSKYQDGDDECGQCKFNDTCRREVLRQVSTTPLRPTATTVPFPSSPPVPMSTMFRPVVPPPPPAAPPLNTGFRPTTPVYAPYPSASQYPPPQTFQHPQNPQPQPQPVYHHPHLPHQTPDPAAPWVRPGSAMPPYYFTQYPQETAAVRLGKNMILRAIAAIFAELLGFASQWTWPPSGGNNKNSG